MKRALTISAVVLAVVLCVGFLVPSMRRALIGVGLQNRMPAGWRDKVQANVAVLRMTEIRGLTEGSGLECFGMSEAVQPELFSFDANIGESAAASGNDKRIDYTLAEIIGTQLGQQMLSDWTGSCFNVRLQPLGLPAEVKQTGYKRQQNFARLLVSEMMPGWWPALPSKRVRIGDTWNGRWEMPVEYRSAAQEFPYALQSTLTYKLKAVDKLNGLPVAQIEYSGPITATRLEEMPENLEILAKGAAKGNLWLNISTGLAVRCDDRSVYFTLERDKDSQTEMVSMFDKKSRMYRPRLLPNAGADFDCEMPELKDLPSQKAQEANPSEPTSPEAAQSKPAAAP